MHCRSEIPDSAAYEMHELAEDYSNWKISGKDADRLSDLIISDVLRLLKRKSAGMSTDLISREDLQSMLTSTEPYEAISRMASELILARRIAQAMNQASGRKNPKEVSSASEVI
jgi:beta-lactamase class A